MTTVHAISETRRPLAPRLLVSFIAALSLILGPLAFAPANAADGFSITGSVGGEDVDELPEGFSVELQVFIASDDYFQSYAYADTEALGGYSFADIPAGRYRVVASAEGNFVTHIGTPFELTADRTIAPITLEAGGSVSGTVSETGTGDILGNVTVEAYPWDGTSIDRDFNYRTDVNPEDGTFLLDGLPAGAFKIQIRQDLGNHVSEYYDDASTAEAAETVTVQKGADEELDPITLDLGASFTGTLKNFDGTTILDASVAALPVVDGVTQYENAVGAYSDENGDYAIQGLPAGTYKIHFSGNYRFFDEFYNDKATEALADDQTIALGVEKPLGTTVLEQTAEVSGSVRTADGDALGDILVEALPVVGGVVAEDGEDYAYTDEDGVFNLRDLHAGTYRLKVQDGLHVYADNADTEITITEGDTKEVEPVVLTLAPVVPPVVQPQPIPYTPPAAPAPVVKKSATVKVSAKGAKKKATLTISVKASGVTPTGKVTIKLGNKTLKTVTLKRGKATVTLTKQKKGKRAYKVIYSGDSKVRGKTVTTSKVKIK